jgi:hypothetical protein
MNVDEQQWQQMIEDDIMNLLKNSGRNCRTMNAELPVPLDDNTYEPVEESRLVISAVGDIMMHMPQIRSAQQSDGSYDFKECFS